MTRFSAASRSSLLTIAKLFLVGLHGFRSKIPHFATKAIFEMSSRVYLEKMKRGPRFRDPLPYCFAARGPLAHPWARAT